MIDIKINEDGLIYDNKLHRYDKLLGDRLVALHIIAFGYIKLEINRRIT
jgi:hypothetical protein